PVLIKDMSAPAPLPYLLLTERKTVRVMQQIHSGVICCPYNIQHSQLHWESLVEVKPSKEDWVMLLQSWLVKTALK
ncbi:Uncharacterized protein DAT39_005583, partial [Clarias magur]